MFFFVNEYSRYIKVNVELTNLDPAALLISTENTWASFTGLPENNSLIYKNGHVCIKRDISIVIVDSSDVQ